MSLIESFHFPLRPQHQEQKPLNPFLGLSPLTPEQLRSPLEKAGTNRPKDRHTQTHSVIEDMLNQGNHPHINFYAFHHNLYMAIIDEKSTIINLCNKRGSNQANSFLTKSEHFFDGNDSILKRARAYSQDLRHVFIDTGAQTGVQSINFIVLSGEQQKPYLLTFHVLYDTEWCVGRVNIPLIETEKLE